MRNLLFCAALAFVGSVGGVALAAERPYSASADAKADIQTAFAAAGTAHQSVLLIFGANWCEDCRALDHALKTGRNAERVAGRFKVVEIDVGNFDRNLDVVAAYGNPIKRGIPAAVIVSADHRTLFATRAGELANARTMSEDGVYELLSHAADAATASASASAPTN